MTASCGPTLLERIKALVLKEPDLPAQAIADRCGCSRSTVSMARAQLGLRKWRWTRKQHIAGPPAADSGLPRCEWCQLLKPCTCTGPMRAEDYLGRRDEPVASALGW